MNLAQSGSAFDNSPRPRFLWNVLLSYSTWSRDYSRVMSYMFTVVERARSKFISESSESKLNSDFSEEKEMILRQNLDVLVPKYIGTISFVFHFLEQIQRVEWGATVFGSWVDVIRYHRPRLPKTRSWNTSSATLKGHRKSRIQPNSKISSPKCFK